MSEFKQAWWLANPHLQSIVPTRIRRAPIQGRWFDLKTRDEDVLQVKSVEVAKPLVLLLHGLGGCAESLYVRGMQRALNRHGFSTWAWNARGSVAPNNRADTYHGGRYTDVQDLIDAAGDRPVFALGFSLGGSMLVNALGRDARGLRAAMAVSCPFGFVDNVKHLDGRAGRIYRRYLLGRLRRMAARKRDHGVDIGADWADRYPSDSVLAQLTTFQAFDDALTGPLNGFDDAMDLYQSVDPAQVVEGIKTPTLLLQADDDPLFAPGSRPPEARPQACQFELTRGGGHVGFVTGAWPGGARYYAEQRAIEFFRPFIGDRP